MARQKKTRIISDYRGFSDLFPSFPLDLTELAKFIAGFVPVKADRWTLTMDRTNWKFGKLNINILTLGIAYNGTAFPLIWMVLPKRGNSSTNERIQLIDRFISIFGVEKIRCLTADREFIGGDWFSYRKKTHIVSYTYKG